MPITAPPTPPSRADATNFSSRADAFFAWFPTFVTEFNSFIPATVGGSITGALSVTQNSTLGSGSTNTVAIQAGSAALPALIPAGDPNTGVWFPAADTIGLTTAGVERMRFESGGDVRVGTGNGSNTVGPAIKGGGFTTSSNGMIIRPEADGTNANRYESYVNNTASRNHLAFYNPNGVVGGITTSGSATSYATSSDARLKVNINPAGDAGAIIDAIQVRSFDWRGVDGGHVSHGFVAQELVAHAPLAVVVGDAGADVVHQWAVDASKLVALLLKEVQTLRTRVAALEAA